MISYELTLQNLTPDSGLFFYERDTRKPLMAVLVKTTEMEFLFYSGDSRFYGEDAYLLGIRCVKENHLPIEMTVDLNSKETNLTMPTMMRDQMFPPAVRDAFVSETDVALFEMLTEGEFDGRID